MSLEGNSMYDFVYITKKEAKSVKSELLKIIIEVQDRIRDKFTFQFKPVGSSSRNMITYDKKSNIGYDFDFGLIINDAKVKYTPKEYRDIIKNAMDRVVPKYGYKCCEDSTSVLTIKKVNTNTCRILHSCDFALIHNCKDGNQQYIRFNKKKNTYTWEVQGGEFKDLDKKIKWLKVNKYWGELRKYYIDKKNHNNDPDKHSRSILAEAVNEMYQKKRY